MGTSVLLSVQRVYGVPGYLHTYRTPIYFVLTTHLGFAHTYSTLNKIRRLRISDNGSVQPKLRLDLR